MDDNGSITEMFTDKIIWRLGLLQNNSVVEGGGEGGRDINWTESGCEAIIAIADKGEPCSWFLQMLKIFHNKKF